MFLEGDLNLEMEMSKIVPIFCLRFYQLFRMKGPNYIHCITGEINAVLGQMKLSTRYTSAQRFYKEIPMVVCYGNQIVNNSPKHLLWELSNLFMRGLVYILIWRA